MQFWIFEGPGRCAADLGIALAGQLFVFVFALQFFGTLSGYFSRGCHGAKEGEALIFWGLSALPLLGAQPIARNYPSPFGTLLSHIPDGEKKRFRVPRCPVLCDIC
jgi:hypothetical protein